MNDGKVQAACHSKSKRRDYCLRLRRCKMLACLPNAFLLHVHLVFWEGGHYGCLLMAVGGTISLASSCCSSSCCTWPSWQCLWFTASLSECQMKTLMEGGYWQAQHDATACYFWQEHYMLLCMSLGFDTLQLLVIQQCCESRHTTIGK